MDLVDLVERLGSPWVGRRGLRVRWFEPWSSELDDAVRHLPESEACPHELLALLMRNPSPMRKRTALVTRGHDPVAVIPLRRRNRFWEPVWGAGVNERFRLPLRDGYLVPALAATGADIWMIGRDPPARDSAVRSVRALPIFRIDLRSDFERHWRSTSHWKTVKHARRRAEGLVLDVDPPGGADWTIRSWAARWGAHEAESDMLLAARYYAERGLYRSFVVRDGETWAAGCTFIVVEGELLAQLNHYAPEYKTRGAQTRLDDLVFHWAAERGYRWMDFGCSYREESYKRHWAPRDGTAWLFNVAPAHVDLARTVVRAAREGFGAARAGLLLARRRSP